MGLCVFIDANAIDTPIKAPGFGLRPLPGLRAQAGEEFSDTGSSDRPMPFASRSVDASIMVNYRRNRMPGGTYFFTVTLANRSSSLLTDHVDLLGHAMREVRTRHPFETMAIVVLPDHLHAIWRLPEDDAAYSMFTRKLGDAGVRMPQRTKGERRVWARRFREHTIRDASDMRHHVDYIHFNPVKHGWVERAIDWPYSSLYRRVGEGIAGAVAPAMRDAADRGSTSR